MPVIYIYISIALVKTHRERIIGASYRANQLFYLLTEYIYSEDLINFMMFSYVANNQINIRKSIAAVECDLGTAPGEVVFK